MTDNTDITPDDSVNEATDTQVVAALTTVEQVVAFYLEGQRYALPIETVQEIQQIVAFSEVPGGGAGVVGMVNLRGEVIPAVDLRRIIGLASQEYTLETPMIICHVAEQLIAIVVDEVQDVVILPPDCMQDAPQMHSLASKMVGVARLDDGLVYVFDVDKLLGTTITGGW